MKKVITKLIGLYLNVLSVVAPRRAGRIGFELFCHPLREKITERQQEFFNSAERFTLSYKNEVVQAYKWGNGAKNVLFLHGWQSHTYRWRTYIELLDKEEYTVYSLDASGHGLSTGKFLTVPIYCDVIKMMMTKIGRVEAIVSHSLGSFTAIYTLYRNPGLTTQRLVAMAPPGEAKEFFEFYKKSLSLTRKSTDLTIRRFEEVVQQTPDFFSAPYFAAHLTMPGLIIHDEDDLETPVENSKRINKSWKGSELTIAKGSDHNLKSPEVLNAVIGFVTQPLLSI